MNSQLIEPQKDNLQQDDTNINLYTTREIQHKIQKFCKRSIIIILLLLLMVLTISCYSPSQQSQVVSIDANPLPQNLQEKTQQLFAENTHLKSSTINDPLFVRRLVVQVGESLRILSSEFPNLRELIIINPSLRYLEIDPKLKLDVLVVNNTQLETFSYNSSQLRRLTLINNAKMNTFCKSIIPSLEEVFIVKTNITSWYQNSVGNLTKLHFMQSSMQTEPNIGATQIEELYLNGSATTMDSQKLFSKSKIVNIIIDNTWLHFELKISNSTSLQSIRIFRNCNLLSISINYCPKLKSISIYQTLYSVNLLACPSLINLSLDDVSKLVVLNVQHANSINLPIFSKTFCKLSSIGIQNTAIPNFNTFECDSLQYLGLDFSKLGINYYDFPFLSLKQISILNYKSELAINISNYQKIEKIYLQNVQIPQISIFRDQIKEISLKNIAGKQSPVRINISAQSIGLLKIQRVNIIQIKWNITDLTQIRIHNNPKLQQIDIPRNISKIYFLNNSKLVIKQVHPNCTSLALQFQPLPLSKIKIQFPVLEKLYIYNQINQDFKGFKSEFLIELTLYYLNLSEFSLNYLPKLQYLKISATNLQVFANNELPSLKILLLIDNDKLNWSNVVKELGALKSGGTQLQEINVPYGASEQLINSIKELFPNIKILK